MSLSKRHPKKPSKTAPRPTRKLPPKRRRQAKRPAKRSTGNISKRRLAPIRLTVAGWCEQTGMNYETTRIGLISAGHETGKGTAFTLREFVAATTRRGEYERARKTAAQADAQELKNETAAGRLVPMEVVERRIADRWGPARDFVIGMPAKFAGHVNPADPQAGRHGLEAVRDEWLRVAKEKPPG